MAYWMERDTTGMPPARFASHRRPDGFPEARVGRALLVVGRFGTTSPTGDKLVDVHLDDAHLGLQPVPRHAGVPYYLVPRDQIDAVTRRDLVTTVRLRGERPIELTAYRGAPLDEVYRGELATADVAALRRFEPLAELTAPQRARYRRALAGMLAVVAVATAAVALAGSWWAALGIVLGAAVALGTGVVHKLLVVVVRGASAVAAGRRGRAPGTLLVAALPILAPAVVLVWVGVLLAIPALSILTAGWATFTSLVVACLVLAVCWDAAAARRAARGADPAPSG